MSFKVTAERDKNDPKRLNMSISGSAADFLGIPIQLNDHVGVTGVRFARPHKRLKTAKKWIKRFGLKYTYKPFAVKTFDHLGRDVIICNQLGYNQLIEQVRKSNDGYTQNECPIISIM